MSRLEVNARGQGHYSPTRGNEWRKTGIRENAAMITALCTAPVVCGDTPPDGAGSNHNYQAANRDATASGAEKSARLFSQKCPDADVKKFGLLDKVKADDGHVCYYSRVKKKHTIRKQQLPKSGMRKAIDTVCPRRQNIPSGSLASRGSNQ